MKIEELIYYRYNIKVYYFLMNSLAGILIFKNTFNIKNKNWIDYRIKELLNSFQYYRHKIYLK